MACFRPRKHRTALFLEAILGQPCSAGLTVKLQNLVTDALRPAYDERCGQLPAQSVLNIDEQVFGLADNGTNPSVLIVIEARVNKDGILAWHQAHSRMTADTGKVTFDEATIWEIKPVNVPNDPTTNFDNWMYYFMRRNLTTLR